MTPGYHNDHKWSEAVHQVGCFPVDSEDTISFMQAVRYRRSKEVHIFRVSGCRDGRFCQRKTSCFVMPRGHWVKYSPKMANSLHMRQLNALKIKLNAENLMVTPYKRLRGMKVGKGFMNLLCGTCLMDSATKAWHVFLGCRISTLCLWLQLTITTRARWSCN